MNKSSIVLLLAASLAACSNAVPVTAAPSPPPVLEAVAPPAALPPEIKTLPDDQARLVTVIAAYQAIAAAGGWPLVPEGRTLRPGDRDARIFELRNRLLDQTDSDLFDPDLATMVRHFQHRHGLEEDGIVGSKTLAALNIPIDQRIAQLQHNLKLIQVGHRQWDDRYIAVNVAAATYRLVENGQTVFERRVIVGRPNWPTPLLNSVINEIVLHPTWTVPPRIAQLELLPRIKRDAGYLADHDMRWVDGMIRQAAGPRNPLGKVKFVFPNDESVYLHDTNAPSLFNEAERHLSHGCVRLSNAVELARYLLLKEPGWNEEGLAARLAEIRTERIRLSRPIPVHLVYDTAWVDPDGTVHFRDDVYGRDRP
ncbi:MAG: L,D-transpeptidase family protein [Rhodospirillaceae bacterium]|nr:L,D-transpeptidase family protein [Rhodospirillaceae bacterium]